MFHARACSVRAYTARVATLVLQKKQYVHVHTCGFPWKSHTCTCTYCFFLSHVIEMYDSKWSQIMSNNICVSKAREHFEPKYVFIHSYKSANQSIFRKRPIYILPKSDSQHAQNATPNSWIQERSIESQKFWLINRFKFQWPKAEIRNACDRLNPLSPLSPLSRKRVLNGC